MAVNPADSLETPLLARVRGSSGAPSAVSIVTSTLASHVRDQEAAQALLEEQLKKQLAALIGEDGQVEDISFSARVSGGRLEVTLTAQCLEEIGQERPGVEAENP